MIIKIRNDEGKKDAFLYVDTKKDCGIKRFNINGIVDMPKHIVLYNGNSEPCDVLYGGPCTCSAFHGLKRIDKLTCRRT